MFRFFGIMLSIEGICIDSSAAMFKWVEEAVLFFFYEKIYIFKI